MISLEHRKPKYKFTRLRIYQHHEKGVEETSSIIKENLGAMDYNLRIMIDLAFYLFYLDLISCKDLC